MERKERRHHTREFKLVAVRLAAAGDKAKAKVARELWNSPSPPDTKLSPLESVRTRAD